MAAAAREISRQIHDFLSGSALEAYQLLGAHPVRVGDIAGWQFRVWAPEAASVHVAGPFNGWTADNCPMQPLEGGVWECFVPGLAVFDSYQYIIRTKDAQTLQKSDPFAFHAQTRPEVCSKLYDLSGYRWNDGPWLAYRSRRALADRPMNIYEVHLGSWRRTGEGEFLSYRDTAKWLVPYVKEMGYTAVEFLPVTEHPLDDSWGYQCTGYFAPTSRFGTPHDFMYLVDQLHQAGVAVLLDWVPGHFPQDAHGLARFDGTPCYEYADPRKAELPQWHTLSFDFGKGAVRSFLTSSALFWLREYHIDGLRMDAVASMLYLDYDGRPWTPNEQGGRENLEAVALLRHLNGAIHREIPEAVTIAEESTAWPGVTAPADAGALALDFTLKWNMGWSHDALGYVKLDPLYRRHHHRDLTFSLTYAWSERYILPVSHDEVVHRKGSLISRMSGDDPAKFAMVRVFYLYMLTHPGKKLTMMGTEFGQFREWDFRQSLDWHLLDYLPFRQHQTFFRQANRFYLEHPALWALDDSPEGFCWIYPDDEAHNTLVCLRRDGTGSELIVALNFSGGGHMGYRIGVPEPGTYQVIFHTDSSDYGGSGRVNLQPTPAAPLACQGQEQSVCVDLPPLTGIVLRRIDPV